MKRFLYLKVKHSGPRIAEACFQFTPKVSLYGDTHLYLEIGSTAKVFGGEMNLLLKADELLSSFFEPTERQWVVGDRMEWARSCVQPRDMWLPPGKQQGFFWALPVQQLAQCGDPMTLGEVEREREQLALFMMRVGLKRVGDFAGLSCDAVTHRFGNLGLELHEWVHGKKELLPPLYVAQEKIQETVDGEEIPSLETLLFILRAVLVRFEAQLKGRAQAAKVLKFEFVLESSAPLLKYLEISDPCQDTTSLVRLLQDFFRNLSWDSPLVCLHLQIAETVAYSTAQLSLFEKLENRSEELGKFIGRLRGRFGEEEVGVPELLESYLPEKSWRLSWPVSKKPTARGREFPDRPLFLLPKPTPFPFPDRYVLKPSEEVWAEWWNGGGQRRYFIAEKESSPSLWIFSEEKKWFIHGAFD